MEDQQLVEVLAAVLATNDKWMAEVESNVMLQNTLEELFEDPVFRFLLDRGLVPKYQRTYLPHFRAVELACAVREVVRQTYEDKEDHSKIELQIENFQLKISEKFSPHMDFEVEHDLDGVLADASRLADTFKSDPQFSARLENFRLLALPLSVPRNGGQVYQLLVFENIRPPRQTWARN